MKEYSKIDNLITALDYCSRSKCQRCPYRVWNADCKRILNSDASRLIKNMVDHMKKSKFVAPAEIYQGERVVQRLDEGCAHWRKNLIEAASFITRYKQYATYAILDDYLNLSKKPKLASELLFEPRKYDRNKFFTIEDKEDAVAYSDFLLKEIHKAYKANEEYEFFKKFEYPLTPRSIEQSADHKTVCVLWQDGSKTIVKLSDNDKDDIDTAFAYALAKKIFGTNTHLKKVVRQKLNEHKPKNKKGAEDAPGC